MEPWARAPQLGRQGRASGRGAGVAARLARRRQAVLESSTKQACCARRQLHWFGFNVLDVKRMAPSGEYGELSLEVTAQPHPGDWRCVFVRALVGAALARWAGARGSSGPSPVGRHG